MRPRRMTSTARRFGFVFVFVTLLTLASAVPAVAGVIEKQLVLTVGQQDEIDVRKVRSYSVGDRDHVEVRLSQDGSKLVVVARKAGTTSILLLRDGGDNVRFTIRIAR